ncbi:MAG: Zn-dependent hydrolase [Ilumatobacteraceae bacterium]
MIDGERLLRRIAELGAIGRTDGVGITRLAYSAEDVAARALVGGWMADAGLAVTVDAAGNLVGRSAGGGRQILLGSHIDTVRDAGALDGCYGVLSAIEVADALRDEGAVSVVAFANEEGASGLAPFTGSSTLAGRPVIVTAELTSALAATGGDAGSLAAAAWPAEEIGTYLELHIEQGPVLISAGRRIGAVTAVTGQRNLDVHVTGAANHAGTTPMDLRHDALAAAADVVLAVESLGRDGHVRVATVGRLHVEPGSRNVVPGHVGLSVDVRDVDEVVLGAAVARLAERLTDIAAARAVTITVEEVAATPPVACAEPLVAIVEQAAAAAGAEAVRLPSGAGHDAQIIGLVAPMAMIFVPSTGGVSHSPLEHTEPADLVLGAEVLLGAARQVLAAEPPPPEPGGPR